MLKIRLIIAALPVVALLLAAVFDNKQSAKYSSWRLYRAFSMISKIDIADDSYIMEGNSLQYPYNRRITGSRVIASSSFR